jgi:hypothetical protein
MLLAAAWRRLLVAGVAVAGLWAAVLWVAPSTPSTAPAQPSLRVPPQPAAVPVAEAGVLRAECGRCGGTARRADFRDGRGIGRAAQRDLLQMSGAGTLRDEMSAPVQHFTPWRHATTKGRGPAALEHDRLWH